MLLLFGAAATLASAGGACRMMSGRGKASAKDDSVDTKTNRIQSFDDLVKLETDGIFFDTKRRSKDEQYVAFREADLIGLALSGGGIRSASFNLGLLQGFRELRLSTKTPDATIDEELWKQLEFSETDEDTLLALDLQQWRKRQSILNESGARCSETVRTIDGRSALTIPERTR